MSIDGSWKIKMSTPIGPQEGELVLSSQDGTLNGHMDQMGNKSIIENGTISDEGHITYTFTVLKPMKLTVNVTADYDGKDKITGKAKLGFIGNATLEAVRA